MPHSAVRPLRRWLCILNTGFIPWSIEFPPLLSINYSDYYLDIPIIIDMVLNTDDMVLNADAMFHIVDDMVPNCDDMVTLSISTLR